MERSSGNHCFFPGNYGNSQIIRKWNVWRDVIAFILKNGHKEYRVDICFTAKAFMIMKARGQKLGNERRKQRRNLFWHHLPSILFERLSLRWLVACVTDSRIYSTNDNKIVKSLVLCGVFADHFQLPANMRLVKE